jgi:hypothetical protein
MMSAERTNSKNTVPKNKVSLVRNSLELLTMVATERKVSVRDLYEWSVRPQTEIDAELKYAVAEGLLFAKRRGEMEIAGGLSLTSEGNSRVMLNWIARHGGATTDHMTRKFKLRKIQTFHILDDTREKGLLRLGGAMNFEPLLYIATQKGLDLVKRGELSELPLASRDEGHLRACLDMAITLEEEFGPRGKHGLHWELWGEREHLSYNNGKSATDRFASPGYEVEDKKFLRRPDLLHIRRFRGSERVEVKAYEIELTGKPREWLLAIFWAYLGCESIDQVVYHVSSLVRRNVKRSLAESLSRVEREVAAGNLEREAVSAFTIVPLPEAVVPARRRAPFYVPQPLPGSEELYKAAMASSDHPEKLRFELLNMVQWVTLNGVATPNALERWLDPSDRAAAVELLKMAHGAGWLYHSDILRAEGSMFYATEEGRNAVGRDLEVYEIDYTDDPHYYGSAALCRTSRIAAELAREFPLLRVKSRWELRGDCMFNGSKMLEVAMPGEGLGYCRRPALLVVSPSAPHKIVMAVVIIPSHIQRAGVKTIVTRWRKAEQVPRVRFYIGHQPLLELASELVADTDEVEVMRLPPGSKEEEPLSDEESLAACSLALGTRTAWVNT